MSTSRPVFARGYSRLRPVMDSNGLADHRRELVAGLTGRVLEVGCGDGGNFAHYPPQVTSVVAVEPEPFLRARARRLAASAPVPVEVVEGRAERLPVADAGVDAAVVSLVLCSVAHPPAALAELYRVLRPEGQLRFLEHVAADRGGLRVVQRALDRTVWPLLVGGCHCSRDTQAAITASGFDIERVRRLRFPDSRFPTPTSPHILGSARRPASAV